MRTMRSVDVFDPYFRRMEYIRYGEDFVVLISGKFWGGTHAISKIKDFLKSNSGLELNVDKTIISNIGRDK